MSNVFVRLDGHVMVRPDDVVALIAHTNQRDVPGTDDRVEYQYTEVVLRSPALSRNVTIPIEEMAAKLGIQIVDEVHVDTPNADRWISQLEQALTMMPGYGFRSDHAST